MEEVGLEKKEDGQESDSGNALQQFALYDLNDELIDKLKLLNYEEEYAKLATSHRTASR